MPAISAIVTLVVHLIAGVMILVMMLIAMNGYSESDSTWGLGAFVVLAFLTAIAAAVGSYSLGSRLAGSGRHKALAFLIPTAVFSVIGVVVMAICGLIGIGVAEFVRVNY